jgi:hypothetical protein
MKLSRLRRVLKWTGTGTCLVIASAAAVCMWCVVFYDASTWSIGISSGALWVTWDRVPPRTARRFAVVPLRRDFPNQWIVYGLRPQGWGAVDAPTVRLRTVPLWILFVAIGLPTTWLWRLDRRRPAPGACRCGYDLTGNTSGRCPECGQAMENSR